jgi:hypothetical protein
LNSWFGILFSFSEKIKTFFLIPVDNTAKKESTKGIGRVGAMETLSDNLEIKTPEALDECVTLGQTKGFF